MLGFQRQLWVSQVLNSTMLSLISANICDEDESNSVSSGYWSPNLRIRFGILQSERHQPHSPSACVACCFLGYCQSEPWDTRAIMERETRTTTCLQTTAGNQHIRCQLASMELSYTEQPRTRGIHRCQLLKHNLFTLCTFLMSVMISGVEKQSQQRVTISHIESGEK